MPNPAARTALVDTIEALKPEFAEMSDAIWDHAELSFHEEKSVATQIAMLEKHGFRVSRGLADIDTAFVGESGQGLPVIAFLGEFDALAGLSQVAGVAEAKALTEGGTGHGCGHNLLGTGSLLAAVALARYLKENDLPGTVRYYGCPGEEGGSGKTFMARAGIFAGVDTALTWHPAPFNGVRSTNNLAVLEIYYRFKGVAAHASNGAHLGRSALDALELMNVGVNYLREHMPSSARIHYAVTDTGGNAPNVVQARAKARYLVRARSLPELLDLVERVRSVAKGAALMTGTTVTDEIVSGDANLVGNTPLEALMHRQLEHLGPPQFDEDDRRTAAKFQETFTGEDIASAFERFGLKLRRGVSLCDTIFPPENGAGTLVGSTDVGTVSWVVPTVQMRGATYAIGTPGHSWQLVAQGKLPAAHKGMEHAAKVMASTAVELILDPALIAAAKADHAVRLEGTPFVNPIPDDVDPPIPGVSHG